MLRQDSLVADATTPSKRRLQALIDYVAQTGRARSKVVSNVTDHGLFLLFEHQLAAVDGSRLNDLGADGEDDIWLTVSRPPGPALPPRPDNAWLAPWLAVGVAVLVAPKLADAIDAAALIAAGTHRAAGVEPGDADTAIRPSVDAQARVALRDYAYRAEVEKQYAAYMEDRWVPWADGERRRRRQSRLYVRLFTLHQQMSGSLLEAPVELVWGLGVGVVDVPGTPAAYPLITQLVDLSVNARTGAVEIRPRDAEPRVELDYYAALDRNGAERAAAHRAEQAGRHVLQQASEALSPFDPATYRPAIAAALDALTPVARRAGDLAMVGSGVPDQPLPIRVSEGWVLFARPRSSNLLVHDLEQYRRLLQDIAGDEKLPDAVRAIVSDPSSEVAPVELPRFRGVSTATRPRGVDVDGSIQDLYFPKAFNDEQLRIVQLLEVHDGVVVQGPPGTGKTHTIANIICHWLATGRRVLVTSMKEPALAVLREHLPEQIRPLAISLLGSEHEGMRQFEESVQHIASEVQSIDQAALEAEVAQLEEAIDGLHARLARIETEIGRWARLNQARIDIDGDSLSPMDAAQEILDRGEQYEWIPDALGVGPQYAPRVGDDDMDRLREARRQLGADIEYVAHDLPPATEFPDARALLQMHQGLSGFVRMSAQGRGDLPQVPHGAEGALNELALALARVRALRAQGQDQIARPGTRLHTRLRSTPDADAFKLLEHLAQELAGAAELRTVFLAKPVEAPTAADQDGELMQALQNLAAGRRAFGLMGGFGKTETRRAVEAITVDGHSPAQTADWQHALGFLNLQQRLRQLGARWNALCADLGLAEVDPTQPQGVVAALEQVQAYRAARELAVAEADVSAHALSLFPEWPPSARVAVDDGALAQLERVVAHQHSAQRLGEVWVAKARLQKALEGRSGRVVEDLRVFVNDMLGNPKVDESQLLAAWSGSMAELARLQRLVPWLQTVSEVTQRIAQSGAPQYARLLRQPAGADDRLVPPDWRRAWRMRCVATHLTLIDPQNEFRRLTRVRGELDQDLARAYRDLVVRRTWLQLARNTSANARAALQAYLNAIQRIGKGTGKRAARYRQDAREAASEAHAAIPCWIMPHYRVSETLPVQLGLFDLVIIDEASQSDLSALPAIFRGRRLLIVGDDRQVAPEAIGMEEDRIKALMQRHLAEQVPLYRAQMSADRSIYDLAKVVFARSGVMLKEHFRCVAPIIEYSRREFYHGELLPLRLPPLAERLDPPLVDVLVEDGERRGDVNLPEARFIVDEIKHLLGDARMSGRSIGVVSLLGDEQAVRIWEMLGEELGPETLQRYRIACGDARTFQGKERDVMFLSMVCAPNDVGAPLSRDSFAQRFNVAASRARDRMYLVRSVQPEQLPESDRLRRRLIEHFAAPFPMADGGADPDARRDPRQLCESPLEREIYDWLADAGYRVTPQVRVGTYRIDLVVDGVNHARLAIECDGDKHHGPDKWSADVRRQRVLERVGWTFWRCFASTFVRRRQAVLDDLARTLEALDIHPDRNSSAAPPPLCVLRRLRAGAAR